MSPTAALVWAKHSCMFSVILSWGRGRPGTSTERGSKRQGKRDEWGSGQAGSLGVWLPSLPSPEEALENTDNTNSCSPAKRKCHFYPGLVLGSAGATIPTESGTGATQARRLGWEALPGPQEQRAKGMRRLIAGAWVLNPKAEPREQLSPTRAKAVGAGAGLGAARRGRYGRGRAGSPDSRPLPSVGAASLVQRLPPSATRRASGPPSAPLGPHAKPEDTSPGRDSERQLGPGPCRAPGLGERRV